MNFWQHLSVFHLLAAVILALVIGSAHAGD